MELLLVAQCADLNSSECEVSQWLLLLQWVFEGTLPSQLVDLEVMLVRNVQVLDYILPEEQPLPGKSASVLVNVE